MTTLTINTSFGVGKCTTESDPYEKGFLIPGRYVFKFENEKDSLDDLFISFDSVTFQDEKMHISYDIIADRGEFSICGECEIVFNCDKEIISHKCDIEETREDEEHVRYIPMSTFDMSKVFFKPTV